MRGRGLLVAAAVMQLVGAAIFGLAGVTNAFFNAQSGARLTLVLVGVGITAVSVVYVLVSVALLRGRRWAWITSLALDGFNALAFFALPLTRGVGIGELVILLVVLGAPLFVTIGLLLGGRRAVFPPVAATAAGPPAATLRGG